MPIVTCDCGARLNAPDKFAGKLVKCPKCATPVRVPAGEAAPEPEIDLLPLDPPPPPRVAPPPAAVPAVPAPRRLAKPLPPPAPPVPAWKLYARWALGLALLPLFFSVFTKNDVMERFEQMKKDDPKLAAQIEKWEERRDAKEEELFDLLPEHRIAGALVSRNSMIHWLFAILSAGVFWGFLMLVYPLGNASPHGLWGVGLFTGTLGILLLLGLQIAASATQGMMITGRSILVIIFYIIKFIGFSYRAALDPENGFLLSMLGFTFGVGFCEEVCKLLPLLWHFKRTAKLDLSGAVLWGLASGIGFGVSEGITYSADQYNGFQTGEIYVVRFISCVALHAIWNGFSAVLLWKWQNDIQAVDRWFEWFIPVFKVAGVPMFLHALYDTALKKDHELVALLTAVVSFAAFAWLYERVKKDEPALSGVTT
jgi:RsiW-degrading membrane proteinase PrsW (M82 family)